jgi:hypothetical protein
MKQEAHKPGGDDRVSYPHVPTGPLLLDPAELAKVGAGVEEVGRLVERRSRVSERHGRRRRRGRRLLRTVRETATRCRLGNGPPANGPRYLSRSGIAPHFLECGALTSAAPACADIEADSSLARTWSRLHSSATYGRPSDHRGPSCLGLRRRHGLGIDQH